MSSDISMYSKYIYFISPKSIQLSQAKDMPALPQLSFSLSFNSQGVKEENLYGTGCSLIVHANTRIYPFKTYYLEK